MTDDRPVPPATEPSPAAGAASAEEPGPDPAGAAQSQPGPSGGTHAEPPPITAFAWRNGLVRPRQGRILAGVCGALGRATNTDPVLWRVVLAVLTIFGGIGIFAYLLGWLFLPADGDTASPIEALAGRGRSGTSTVLTIIGGVIVLFSMAAFISEPFRAAPLLGAVLLGGALLLLLRDQQRSRTRAAGPATVTPMWSTVGGSSGSTVGISPPGAGSGEASPPPFAPYGPFAPTTAAAAYPGPPPPPTPPPAPPYGPPYGPPPPPPARAKPPRSRLGLLTISLILVAVGGLALTDLAGFDVPAGGYIAAALATVGIGLLVGAWVGRSRSLIALGIVLSIVLAAAFGAEGFHDGWRGGSITWAPPTIDQVRDGYRHDVGDATLDLSAVDFSKTATPTEIDVRVDVGNLEIIVPSDVDVTVDASVDVGNADIFRQSWGGFDAGSRTVTDLGSDGPGGGQLHITTAVDLGNLEVHR